MPIVFCFGLATLAYFALTTTLPLSAIVVRVDQGIENFVLLTVPLFILLGALVDASGIARRLIDAIGSLVGHVRGGLSIVLVVAMFLVSGISGSKTADMAAVAPALFPEMERRGSQRGEMIALLTMSGAMAETIPPSLVLIIIGTVVGLSIQELFTAGLLPAAVAAIALIVVALLRARGDRTDLAPRPSWSAIGKAFAVAIPGLLLPVVIRFFVVGGITTATEVSAIGVVYALLVGCFIYREFDWKRAYPILRETASLTSVVTFIIGTAMAMGWALTQSGFSQQLATALGNAPGGATRVHGTRHGALRGARFGARGRTGDRAVRTALVSDRARDGDQRDSLRHRRGARNGHRTLRSAARRWVLRRLCDRQDRPRRCGAPDHAVSAGARRRSHRNRGRAVVLARLSQNIMNGRSLWNFASDSSEPVKWAAASAVCSSRTVRAFSPHSTAAAPRARSASRGPASRSRAAMRSRQTCAIVLSIVPPDRAVAVARDFVAAYGSATHRPLFVDCNAIAPATAHAIDAVVSPSGVRFLDAGIIGTAPAPDYDGPAVYASGAHVTDFERLTAYGLKVVGVGDAIGNASALKMSYAGISKGVTGIGEAMFASAQRAGVYDVLMAELAASQPAVHAFLLRQLPKMPPKAYRWVAEMREIGTFARATPGAQAVYEGFAELYDAIAEARSAKGAV